MNLQDFITGFANQFDDTDEDVFNAETAFQDLEEWSSLTTLTIIAFVKTKYNKLVTGKEIRDCETVKDLFDLVNNKE